MKRFIAGFLAASVLIGGAWFFTSRQGTEKASVQVEQKYHCPMHPTFVSNKPGDCPICGMKLVPIQPGDSTTHSAPSETQSQEAAADEAAPQGYAAITIADDKLQLMGVSTTEVKEMDFDQSIRTTGRVAADETRLHHIHTKFEGYIEKIFVNYTGQFVRRGDPLFSVYSPELLATQREYLLALKSKEQMGSDTAVGGIDLLKSARQRLALWDVGEKHIELLERTGEPVKDVTVHSPVSGYVVAKTAVHGLRVMPADVLYDIVDLSRVWIMADLYEINLPFVKIGTDVTVQLPYGNRSVEGKVKYIDPVLDPATRTLKARIEMPNPENMFKPEMSATVIFGGTRAKGIVVPESAVISTGERAIVFVAKGEGHFQPREVEIGESVRGYYEIKNGLTAGEHVVTSGNFLLDSESRLRAAVSGVSGEHRH